MSSQSNSLEVYTDGSVRDPSTPDQLGTGWGGCGFVVRENGVWVGKAIAIGKNIKPNVAERHGIIAALEHALQLLIESPGCFDLVRIYCDCRSVVGRALGNRCFILPQNPVEHDIYRLQQNLRGVNVDVEYIHIIAHTGIPGNEAADQASKEGSAAAVLIDAERCDWKASFRKG